MLVLISILLVIFILLMLIVGYACFRHSFVRKAEKDPAASGIINTAKYNDREERMKRYLSEYNAENKEIIRISSFDSLSLFASFIPAKNDKKILVIAFHGYRSCAAADFCAIYKPLLDSGISLLLVDQRSHGRSEGKYIGFGTLERWDVLSWCEYAEKRFFWDTSIYLFGVSMGAATVMLSSSLKLPSTVKGIIADCGFSSPLEIIANTLYHRNKIPPYPTVYFINVFTRLLAKYDITKLSCIDELVKSELPLLLIHGSLDRFVPTEMSQRIYDSRKERSRLVLVEGAKHARSQLEATELYINEILKLIFDTHKE